MRALAALVAPLIVILLAAGALPASADGGLQVSIGHEGWRSASAARALFDPALRWVPGDSRIAVLRLRNTTSSTVEVDLGSMIEGDQSLRPSVEFQFLRGGVWTTLRAKGEDVAVGPGRSVAIHVRAGLAADAANSTQSLTMRLRVLVAAEARHPTRGILPNTGADLPWWMPLLGFGSLGLGITVVRKMRREPA